MFNGVEADSSEHISGIVAKLTGCIPMGSLMNGNGENQRNRINGYSLDRIVSKHGNMISIGAKSD